MKNWKLIIKVTVSLGLVFWLVRSVDWIQVRDIVTHATPWLIAGYVLVQLLGNVISAAKWQYLARIQGFQFSVKDGTLAYLSGAFINNFLPSTVGGDTYRVLWMSQIGERTRAFAVVFFDRITGLLALFLFSSMGLAFLPWRTLLEQPAFIIFAAITLSVAIMMLVALFLAERFYQLALFLAGFLPWKKPTLLLTNFSLFANGRVYGAAIGWAVLFTAVGIGGSNFLLFSSLGVDITPLAFVSAIFAATLVANIPISINNIGVKEWSYVFFFGLIGVSAEVAVTAALLSRLLQMGISFIALPQYLAERRNGSAAKQ